jgi:signal transduction histidine kinase
VVPLRTSSGVQGALTLAWSRDGLTHFHEVDVRLPQRFAEQAALALEVDQARVDHERLAVFEDRDRIGRDLHDLVIQRLFAVGLALESTGRLARDRADIAGRLSSAVDDLDSTIKDIRRTIFALSAAEESGDVRSTVLELVERAARTLKSRPQVRFAGPVNAAAGPFVRPHLAAVLGEALSNVVRHSDASDVQVTLEAGDSVSLTVADDGRGIPDGVEVSGLKNMRERAEQLGGSCTVTSAPGRGTTVVWRVPAEC